jgi:hypothetical protein
MPLMRLEQALDLKERLVTVVALRNFGGTYQNYAPCEW